MEHHYEARRLRGNCAEPPAKASAIATCCRRVGRCAESSRRNDGHGCEAHYWHLCHGENTSVPVRSGPSTGAPHGRASSTETPLQADGDRRTRQEHSSTARHRVPGKGNVAAASCCQRSDCRSRRHFCLGDDTDWPCTYP